LAVQNFLIAHFTRF